MAETTNAPGIVKQKNEDDDPLMADTAGGGGTSIGGGSIGGIGNTISSLDPSGDPSGTYSGLPAVSPANAGSTSMLGSGSSNPTGVTPTGESGGDIEGLGLGKLASMAAGYGGSSLAGLAGAGPVSGLFGQLASGLVGNGITGEGMSNAAINAALSAMGVPGALMGILGLLGFNPVQGLGQIGNTKDYEAEGGSGGTLGGFFGKVSDYNGYEPGGKFNPGTTQLRQGVVNQDLAGKSQKEGVELPPITISPNDYKDVTTPAPVVNKSTTSYAPSAPTYQAPGSYATTNTSYYNSTTGDTTG